GKEPRPSLRQAGRRQGVLPNPLAHVGNRDGVRSSLVHRPGRGGHVRPIERAGRHASDYGVARAAGRYHDAASCGTGTYRNNRFRPSGSGAAVKTPPRLIARTLTVTFVMVAVILTVVFAVITLDVRDRVRAAETEKLRVSENVFSALETKRQQDQVAAMATLAENPTLKAALDTYFTERSFSGSSDEQLRALVAGTSLDANYAQELSNLSTAGVVITVNNSVVARTVPENVARDLVASK